MALIRQRHLVKLVREVDVFIARELAAELAKEEGFDAYDRSDIETAVSELCSNAIKYGERGWASLRLDDRGFEAAITDEGPGLGEAPPKSGLGVGLAGAKRLMDSMTIEQLPAGTRIRVTKHHPARLPSSAEWSVDAVARLRVGSSVSGDRFLAREDRGVLRVALVDGLGSGEHAAAAAIAVIDSLAASGPAEPLQEGVRRAHRAAAATRGAVALVVRVDPGRGVVEHVGIGDVSGVIGPGREPLMSRPGVLGIDEPPIELCATRWTPGSRLVLWTDGIGRPDEDDLDIDDGDVDKAEEVALRRGTERDDGTLLVASRRTR